MSTGIDRFFIGGEGNGKIFEANSRLAMVSLKNYEAFFATHNISFYSSLETAYFVQIK